MKIMDNRLIILATNDSVGVARCTINAGELIKLDGVDVRLAQALCMGHKLALRPMETGEKVLKYGVSIGSATTTIAVGDHVHLHNMQSDYTPTFSLTESDA